jgi:hypothetical protein
MKSVLTVTFPEAWLYVLGVLFIAVTLFMPHGIVGLLAALRPGAGPLGRLLAVPTRLLARLSARWPSGRRDARGGTPRPQLRE